MFSNLNFNWFKTVNQLFCFYLIHTLAPHKTQILKNLSHKIITVFSILLLLVSLVVTQKIIIQAKQNQQIKFDKAEVNSILYGLLNVNEWKDEISNILSEKINNFEITPENQTQLQSQVENVLYRLLDEVDKILKSDMGRIKRFLMYAFVDLEKLRENVPELTVTLLEEMNKPENKENLKNYFNEKLDEYADETYNNDQQLKLIQILERYNFNNKEQAAVRLQKTAKDNQNRIMFLLLLLIAILVLVFLANYFSAIQLAKSQLLILLLVSFVFLLNGISIPMIDIEATISQITFQLLGEEIAFHNQVLFFQSKSILDVVWILISTKKIDMVIVGTLIFTFSVLFPAAKMVSGYLCIVKPDCQRWRGISFFTYKSGKWSMADVFVVAIFMAFVGFNGIVNDQLSGLNSGYKNVEIITDNGTFLQPGFYLFLLFCITGLFLGDKISKQNNAFQNT